MQVNLHAAFFFFTSFGCFAPEGFFLRVAFAASGFRLTSLRSCRIPPGVPFFQIITPVEYVSCNWCFFFQFDKSLLV